MALANGEARSRAENKGGKVMKRLKEMLDDDFVRMAVVIAAIVAAVGVPLSPML